MADYFNPTTDFQPELPQYAKDIVEPIEEEELIQQQQAQAMEEEIAAGEKAGPPSPELDQGEPAENLQPEEEPEEEVQQPPQNALDYLSSGRSIAGNPMETMEDLTTLGQGLVDTTLDIASSLLPWLKPVDDWWEEVSGKKQQAPEDKFVRDVSAIVIPTALTGGAASAGLTSAATKLGYAGLTKGGTAALGKVAVDAAAGTIIEGFSEQTYEAGNLSDLLNNQFGIQTPWATQEDDSPDVIYKKNMYESAALGGVVGIFDVALSSNLFKGLKQETTVVPKNAAAKEAIEDSSLITHIKFKDGTKASIRTMDKVAIDDNARVAAQNEEAVIRFKKATEQDFTETKETYIQSKLDIVSANYDELVAKGKAKGIDESQYTPEVIRKEYSEQFDRFSPEDKANLAKQYGTDSQPKSPTPYDPFYNEPHAPQQRAVPDYNGDTIKFKADNAKIQNNLGTVNGRPNPPVTPGWKRAFSKAADGTDRSELLEQVAEGLDPQFDVMVGPNKLDAKQVDEAVDNLVVNALNAPDTFKKDFKELVKATDSVLGNKTTSLTEDGFIVATGAYKRLLDMLGPRQQRASASIVSNAANNVSDASKAVGLIGETVDSSRQQELVFEALRVMMPEIRVNQLLSGKRLQMKKVAKDGDKNAVKNFIEDTTETIDEQVAKAKKDVEGFLDSAIEVAHKNPEFLKPLLREFEKSNGSVDSIHKLSKLAESKISFWKKAFIDGEPEVPSLFVKQLQSARYNNILMGLAPVRAAAGAFTGLIGKPVTSFAGSTLTGDTATLKRSMFVFGGIKENLGRAFTNLADEWRYANENTALSEARVRKDYIDQTAQDMETMDEMAEVWRANGENGKVAMWNITKWLSYFNGNNIVRAGINAMTAIDGFSRSMSASFSARSQAYDELFSAKNGAINVEEYTALQRKLYDQKFDRNGVLKDDVAEYMSREINLNMDSKTVTALEDVMRHIPIAKSIFMFPRTGVNAIQLVQTFSPTGLLGKSIGRGKAALNAVTQAEIDDVLVTHGYQPGNNAAFKALKSEYKGREIMGGAVVAGAALYALNGNLTGSGPQDQAERKRMMDLGWQPYSFRDWNGEWRSYQGMEPFDTFLGLTADLVFEGQRFDSAITEEWFQTLAASISMNITNKTFLSGFEPLVRFVNGDPGALQRFAAMQVDSLIPGTGVRSILNKAIAPQLKDVEANFAQYLANRNKFLPPVNQSLYDLVDVYTGKPINYIDPINAGINSLLPFFKTNGGTEKWRQQLLESGWDNLQTIRTNPISGEPLTPEERNFINNWIGENYGLDKKMEEFFNMNDGQVEKELKAYAKKRGLKKQSQFPIKKTWMYEQLDAMHSEAFKAAFAALEAQRTVLYNKGVLQKATKSMIRQGDYQGAADSAQQILNMPK